MEQDFVNTHRRYVGLKENIVFGVANGGQVLSFSLLVSYLTYFYVNIFNIDPKIVATMIFFEGIGDTINDPLMGSVVDRTRAIIPIFLYDLAKRRELLAEEAKIQSF